MTDQEKKDDDLFSELENDDTIEGEISESAPVATSRQEADEEELTVADLERTNFAPKIEVGKSIVFDIKKIIKSNKTVGVNRDTGDEFPLGVKTKKGEIIRRDLITDQGVYTIRSWSVYFAFFGRDGVIEQAIKKGKVIKDEATGKVSYDGFKVRITRVYDGSHALRDEKELMKLLDMNLEEAKAYKKKVGKAVQDGSTYKVELVE
jgi:hypothetical protein